MVHDSFPHRDLIRDYYHCFRTRDRERLNELLAPQIHFRGPFGRWVDRDTMLDEIWPMVGKVWAEEIEIFGEGPTYMVRYVHSSKEASRLAEFIQFGTEGQIVAVEVYINGGGGSVPPPTAPE